MVIPDEMKTKLSDVRDAIICKINTLIQSHNENNSAHSTLFNEKANINHSNTNTTYGVSSSSKYGHAKAGGNPQPIGTTLSAGTDNGTYARTDHIHTVAYSNISGTPVIPEGSSIATDIQMDGTRAAGSSTKFARANHVHPTDTSRAPVSHSHSTSAITETSALENIGTNANATQHTINTSIENRLNDFLTLDVVEDTLDDNSTYPIQNGTVSKALKKKANGTELTALANSLDASILNLTNQLTQAGDDIGSIELELSNVVKKTDIQENYTSSPGMPVKASVIKQDLDSKVPISDGATKLYDYNAKNYYNINPTMEAGHYATQQNINKAINSNFQEISTYPHINTGFIDDDFNLYLGDIVKRGCDVGAEKQILQKNESTTIVGCGEQNTILYFYEVYKPAFMLTSTKSIIQQQEDITLKSILRDETDGNIIVNQKIYFYEVYTPNISIFSNNNIIQTAQQADIIAKLMDTDGNLIKNETIYFYEVYTPTLKTTSNKSIVQTNEQSDITAKLQDTDGNIIPNTEVYFYKKT